LVCENLSSWKGIAEDVMLYWLVNDVHQHFKALQPSETSVTVYQSAHHDITEDLKLQDIGVLQDI